MKKYNKPHLTFEQQLALLEDRKLVIEDPANAIRALGKIGYYRLSAYWYPFRKNKPKYLRTTKFNYRYDEFEPNHSFEQALALYDFDSRLRLLLLEALGQIEIQLRTKIAYFAGEIDGFIHLRRSLLDKKECERVPRRSKQDSYSYWQENYKKQLKRARSEDFIRHHMERYGEELPIWVATEILDFGSVSKLFEFLPKNVKNSIAPAFGTLQGNVLASWIRNFNYTRNIAAHHSRLWNRLIVTRIQAPNRSVVDPEIFHLADSRDPIAFKKIYPTLALIAYTLSYLEPRGNGPDPQMVDTLKPASRWGSEVPFHHATQDLHRAVQARRSLV
ncbi:Abi family protein, partial [Corynebacterium sp. ACRQM]|uniref:Abi family protein n=1 Tax=unclassified Corynebacterium TaxID=2624378 RepID=UPI001EF6CE35|nr:Abi family protein [Corynebacterium sp. ACRPR]MCG7244212.1 Abi family protein [Corynebacterium sp. ACRPS]MCG7272708.1 Abi family protein [Corynebacterium sp. ACRQM]